MSENLTRNFTHLTIPAEIWLRRDISLQAKCLWAEIRSLHDKERGGCYASDEYLIEFLQVKRSRLYEIYQELKGVGLLETVHFDGRRTIRRAVVPDVEYQSVQQLSGKPDSSNPENRTAKVRKTGSPTDIYSKEENKEYIGAAPKKKIQKNSSKEKKISFGKYVEFTRSQYESLCKIHGKEKVDDIIQRMEDHCVNNRPKGYKDYTAAFRTFLASYKPPQNEKFTNLSHREKVLKRFKHGEIYNGADCYITENAIAFQRGITHVEVRFKDNGFEEQLANMLRKFGINSV